jgi:3-methyladenine DNA glycosylase AlkD
MTHLNTLIKELNKAGKKKDAEILRRFFKTGKGDYGEGDVFIGVRVPRIRQLVTPYLSLSLSDIEKLLNSPVHEHRFAGLVILNQQMKQAIQREDVKTIKAISSFYIKKSKRVNNWDLVDVSAPNILGAHILFDRRKNKLLYSLAKSRCLWDRRISVVATLKLVRAGEFADAMKLCEIHLYDDHDLMQKAVGWVLREVGKKNEKTLTDFLEKYYRTMPRTALRYSLERLSKKQKEHFMKK